MNTDIPIFCINLERAKERKDKIKRQWIDELKLDINFWKAYDKRDILNGHYVYPYTKELSEKTLGRQLSPGEIACVTSYCQLYEHCLENNYDSVIIMEDDVTPNLIDGNELFSTINYSITEFPNIEMLLLHKPPPYQQKIFHEIYNTKKIHASLCKRTPWGNQMFYIKRAGVTKLYSMLKEMRMAADHVQQYLAHNQLVAISNKPLCFHAWFGENSDTYIGNEIRNTHRYKVID